MPRWRSFFVHDEELTFVLHLLESKTVGSASNAAGYLLLRYRGTVPDQDARWDRIRHHLFMFPGLGQPYHCLESIPILVDRRMI